MGGGAYHGAKFALEAMADALRAEAPFGVQVVNVLPGPIATHFEAALLQTIPDAGADSPYAPFKTNLARRMRTFLMPGGFGVMMTADHVATIVFKAATSSHPRTRYNVGSIAKFGPLGRARSFRTARSTS